MPIMYLAFPKVEGKLGKAFEPEAGKHINKFPRSVIQGRSKKDLQISILLDDEIKRLPHAERPKYLQKNFQIAEVRTNPGSDEIAHVKSVSDWSGENKQTFPDQFVRKVKNTSSTPWHAMTRNPHVDMGEELKPIAQMP